MQAVQKVERQRDDDQADEQRKASSASGGRLGVVDDDAVDLIGDVFESVGDPLQILEHFAVDGELQRLGPRMLPEGPLEPDGVEVVGFSLKADQPARSAGEAGCHCQFTFRRSGTASRGHLRGFDNQSR